MNTTIPKNRKSYLSTSSNAIHILPILWLILHPFSSSANNIKSISTSATTCGCSQHHPPLFYYDKMNGNGNKNILSCSMIRRISLLSGGSQENINPNLSSSSLPAVINSSSTLPSKENKNNNIIPSQKKRNNVISLSIIGTITTLSLYILNKESIHSFIVFYSKMFKDWLEITLFKVNKMGNVGLLLYTSIFAIWEFLGQTTCPVETAAGMAFGIVRGIIASSVGRFAGAMLAFIAGRYIFYQSLLQSKLISNNKIISMAHKSMRKHPFRTCLILRYSCFPELIKNLGLAILPVSPFMYAITMLIHAVPFTALWTCVGHEAAIQLYHTQGNKPTPNKILPWFVVAVPIFGIVGAPAIVAIWVNGMMKQEG